ncbi:MAG: tRNA threonylcarbamoyladenosine dehydratase [Bacteroidales bacterium]
MQENWSERTELLIGSQEYLKLKNAHVLVIGLGGVGAYAAEQLVRAGIGTLTMIDGDLIHLTNLNRQLPALMSTLGQAKTEVLAQRFKQINPDLNLCYYTEYIRDERMIEILNAASYDYLIDAIDTLSPKMYLLYHAYQLHIPVVSAMGSGGKLNPSQLHICDISQTYMCPLADVLRKRLHKLGIYTGIYAVFSPEEIPSRSVRLIENELNKKTMVGTISYMPAIVGCMCASVVVRVLLGYSISSDLPVPRNIKKKIASEMKINT